MPCLRSCRESMARTWSPDCLATPFLWEKGALALAVHLESQGGGRGFKKGSELRLHLQRYQLNGLGLASISAGARWFSKKQTLWKNYILHVLAAKVINRILKLSHTRVCSTAVRGILRSGVLSQPAGPLKSPPTTFPLDCLEITQIHCQLVVAVVSANVLPWWRKW